MSEVLDIRDQAIRGSRIMKVKDFPVADMTLAMILVMPVSYVWVTYLLPLMA